MESKAVTLTVPFGSDQQRGPKPALRVDFRWQHDRFAHDLVNGDETLLASEEGNDLQEWPESPPFQEALPHPDPSDPQAILLVGMAGKSHWSASVEVAEPTGGSTPATARTVFDIACRIVDNATNLGSTYRVPSAVQVESSDGTCFRTSSCQVKALPVDGETSCHLQWKDGLLQIQPSTVGAAPTTIRWRYSVEML